MKNMLFVHYVITRFNIPSKDWQYDKNDKVVRDELYYKKRITLFEQFTLPSMMHQTCKDFVWLVYFDPNSPKIISDKFEEWKNLCANFVPCYSSDYEKWQIQELSDYIKSDNFQADFIITTRIDNDDAFHCSAIEEIQNAFIPQNDIIIDIPNGYCYNKDNFLYSKHTFVSGPFISYIEDANKTHIDTVYKEGHPSWKNKARFISIKNRLWIQVIHDSNIANSQHGSICANPSCEIFVNSGGVQLQSFDKIIKAQCVQQYYILKHKLKTHLRIINLCI